MAHRSAKSPPSPPVSSGVHRIVDVAQETWPALSLEAWRETYATLHMCAQIIGKIVLARAPMMNEWWQVAFHVTPRGLATEPIPFGWRTIDAELDFVDHALRLRASDGRVRTLALVPRTVAAFHDETIGMLRQLGIDVHIRGVPVEVPQPIPFAEDRTHGAYDAAAVERFFHVLRQVDTVLRRWRAGFSGKSSPVHFFWGSFDLGVSRFSGRRAPPREGADPVTRVAYDEEVITVGFWPGGGPVHEAAFYAYASPEPEGFARAKLRPDAASWCEPLREHVLPYEDVRRAEDPAEAILAFAESAYEAGARLGGWNREALEWRPPEGVRANPPAWAG